MRQQKNTMQGYTIVEVLIFLAVSGALLVSAMLLVGGQQRRAEFTYGIQELNSILVDISNDVSTGYYTYYDGVQCEVNASGELEFSAGTRGQGSNSDCIYIGRVVHFFNNGRGGSDYRLYSVAGKRLDSSGEQVKDLSDASPAGIDISGIDTAPRFPVPNNLSVKWVRYENVPVTVDVGAIGFFTTFASYSAAGDLESRARNVNVIPVANTSTTSGDDIFDEIINIDNNSDQNITSGLEICIEGANRYAILSVYDNAIQASTDIEVQQGACPI